jgi:hypothetical protein
MTNFLSYRFNILSEYDKVGVMLVQVISNLLSWEKCTTLLWNKLPTGNANLLGTNE